MDKANTFSHGDLVLLIDPKKRQYIIHLDSKGVFHSVNGAISHSEILGEIFGTRKNIGNKTYIFMKPTMADFIQYAKKDTQIIYPKDIGQILIAADVFPGANVLEIGLGSGALSLALLRAIGDDGKLVSYEINSNRVLNSLTNSKHFSQKAKHIVKQIDAYEKWNEPDQDRIIMDIPEPWRAIDNSSVSLKPGGILLCYLPTILQVHKLALSLESHSSFDFIEIFEILKRNWLVSDSSVRPSTRMVGHTGFIVTARKSLEVDIE